MKIMISPYSTILIGFFKKYPVLAYCFFTFLVTWGIKVLYASITMQYGMPAINFGLLASFGPFISAIFLIGTTEGKEGLGVIYRSMTVWRDNVGWIVLAALFEPILFFSITFVYRLYYGTFPESTVGALFPSIISYIFTFVFGIIRWGLSEEIGWRGWMLPKLQEKFSTFNASLIMSVVITLWHIHPNSLPMIAVSKESEYLIGFFPEAVERLIISIPFILVMTYIYNKTNGSLLAMMLFHSASNTSYFWIDETFGVVKSDFFRISFLGAIIILTVVFSLLVIKQKKKAIFRRHNKLRNYFEEGNVFHAMCMHPN